MTEKISWSFNTQVTGGPSVEASGTLSLDAYDKIEASVAASGGKATVKVQPGDGAKFLLITASSYTDLSYKVDGGSAITLDGAHILIGEGAVSLLGTTQQEFEFTNNDSEEVTVEILVGRDAVTTS